MSILKLGSKGPAVQVLEKKLKAQGHLKGPVDATFDARTADAVVAYKTKNGWEDPKPKVGAKMAAALNLPSSGKSQTPTTMKGASYNCRIGRPPAIVARTVSQFAHRRKLDFIQLQEISGYHDALKKIPGYKLISFRGSKDHGETGVLVRKDIDAKFAQSIEADTGWTNDRGGVAQPRAATSVRVAGWLRVASVHAPPGIDWVNGRPVGGEARIKSYQSLTKKLLASAQRQAERNPELGMLIGGDWNEGAVTGGPGSPAWLAAKGGMKKHPTGGIDWEMSRGVKLTDLKRGPKGGSDHPLITFTVSRPRSSHS
ncbi:MAG: peptidoglycan-binding protein [Archangium sp.]|nr:peptidoglycan-binding protein [Archangium sp.]MDP3571949.1 peptidoglycan-binding protein [Archangium sp.]